MKKKLFNITFKTIFLAIFILGLSVMSTSDVYADNDFNGQVYEGNGPTRITQPYVTVQCVSNCYNFRWSGDHFDAAFNSTGEVRIKVSDYPAAFVGCRYDIWDRGPDINDTSDHRIIKSADGCEASFNAQYTNSWRYSVSFFLKIPDPTPTPTLIPSTPTLTPIPTPTPTTPGSGFSPYHGINRINSGSGDKTVAYDEQGNIVSYSVDGMDREIRWDYSSGKPEQVVVKRQDGSTDMVTYYYDGEGNRIAKVVDEGNYTAYVNGYLQKQVKDYQVEWKRNYLVGGKVVAIRDIEGSAIPIPTTSVVDTPTPTPSIAGDLDGDGDVDIFDFNILVEDFGWSGTPGGIASDIDTDGDVDIFDFNILVTNFTG